MKNKSEGYTMIGDSTIYEPKFTLCNERRSKKKLGLSKCNINLCSTLL